MDIWSPIGKAIWGELIPDLTGQISETERALSTVRGFSTLGLAGVAVFGAAASPDGFQESLRGAATAFIAAAGAFGVGGLLGFMFGVPRWEGPAPNNASGQAGATAQSSGGGASSASSAGAVVPNTGLYKIADWLTTLIVGLGLVHLGTAWKYATDISIWLTAEIVAPGRPDLVSNGSPGAAILISYTIAGFFLVFLWALRYMGGELQDAHGLRALKAAIRTQIDAEKVATKSQINSLLDYAAQMVSMPPAAAPRATGYVPSSIDDLRRRGVDSVVLEELSRRYARSTSYDYEPLAGFGLETDAQNGRRLEGSVSPVGEGLSVFDVTLRVVGTDPQKPLAGEVAFLLHHTLPPVIRIVPAQNNEAVLSVRCIGTFIAGAIVLGETTRLSFDLATVPGAPEEFLAN